MKRSLSCKPMSPFQSFQSLKKLKLGRYFENAMPLGYSLQEMCDAARESPFFTRPRHPRISPLRGRSHSHANYIYLLARPAVQEFLEP